MKEKVMPIERYPDKICTCGKEFFHLGWETYFYRIKYYTANRRSTKTIYYCCYTCWIKAKRQLEAEGRKLYEKKNL